MKNPSYHIAQIEHVCKVLGHVPQLPLGAAIPGPSTVGGMHHAPDRVAWHAIWTKQASVLGEFLADAKRSGEASVAISLKPLASSIREARALEMTCRHSQEKTTEVADTISRGLPGSPGLALDRFLDELERDFLPPQSR